MWMSRSSPQYDNPAEKLASVRAGKKGREHPFVVGKDGSWEEFFGVPTKQIGDAVAAIGVDGAAPAMDEQIATAGANAIR